MSIARVIWISTPHLCIVQSAQNFTSGTQFYICIMGQHSRQVRLRADCPAQAQLLLNRTSQTAAKKCRVQSLSLLVLEGCLISHLGGLTIAIDWYLGATIRCAVPLAGALMHRLVHLNLSAVHRIVVSEWNVRYGLWISAFQWIKCTLISTHCVVVAIDRYTIQRRQDCVCDSDWLYTIVISVMKLILNY